MASLFEMRHVLRFYGMESMQFEYQFGLNDDLSRRWEGQFFKLSPVKTGTLVPTPEGQKAWMAWAVPELRILDSRWTRQQGTT